jgi:hypothetical protein
MNLIKNVAQVIKFVSYSINKSKENRLLLQWKMEGSPVSDTKFDLLLKILHSTNFQTDRVANNWKVMKKNIFKSQKLVSLIASYH